MKLLFRPYWERPRMHKYVDNRHNYPTILNPPFSQMETVIFEITVPELNKVLTSSIELSKSEISRVYEIFGPAPIRLTVPLDNIEWMQVGASKVQTCVYDATNDFMGCILGMSLSNSDKTWFQCHPQVSSGGVMSSYIPDIIAGLVAPYGLGISHIWLMKGISIPPVLLEWQQRLGVNPAAEHTRSVSNYEFISSFPETMQHLQNKYNFEFISKLPNLPMIVAAGYGSSVGISIQPERSVFVEGHAQYKAPRDPKPDIWEMALSIGKLNDIYYYSALPDFEYEPQYVIDLVNTKLKDNKTLGALLATSKHLGVLPLLNVPHEQNQLLSVIQQKDSQQSCNLWQKVSTGYSDENNIVSNKNSEEPYLECGDNYATKDKLCKNCEGCEETWKAPEDYGLAGGEQQYSGECSYCTAASYDDDYRDCYFCGAVEPTDIDEPLFDEIEINDKEYIIICPNCKAALIEKIASGGEAVKCTITDAKCSADI